MRKLLYILVSAGLWWPASAAAEDLSPTPAETMHARAVASAYWHTPMAPPIITTTLPAVNADDAAQANPAGIIELSSTEDWRDYPEQTCMIVVHETGHLVLGPTYFAAVNPTDPAHSPDPNSVMYDGPRTLEQQAQASKSVGCYELPPKPRRLIRHHRHHRHR